jgi:AmiR/NasT family two-component response regulator
VSEDPAVPARILIAEDETIIRLDLRELLERAGFEVCAEARDGEEAIELARAEAPDLALLDVKMPRLDGIEAARRILDERPIPIVIVTAYGEQELVSRAVEAGVFGYLVKPFRESDLLPAIATARARHEELQALRAEADSLAEALAARKAIERAKGLLMERDADRNPRAEAMTGRVLAPDMSGAWHLFSLTRPPAAALPRGAAGGGRRRPQRRPAGRTGRRRSRRRAARSPPRRAR